jgi:hypothetical protein
MRRIVFDEEVTRDGLFIHGGLDPSSWMSAPAVLR